MLHRALLCFALVSGFGLSSAAAAPAPADVLKITLDQAQVAKVPTGTTTLVVGNPSIADVTMLKGGVGMVVTGKGYGQTNLVAIDAQGNILDEKQIVVAPTRNVLVVQRGDSRASYTCNPMCMPTVQLGDEDKTFNAAAAQITLHSGLAKDQLSVNTNK
jgi:Pilus formation protein N terminal region